MFAWCNKLDIFCLLYCLIFQSKTFQLKQCQGTESCAANEARFALPSCSLQYVHSVRELEVGGEEREGLRE